MKLFNLKFKKENIPSLKLLRPPLFDTDKYWHLSLGISLLIIILTTFFGLKLFYNEYFESYKKAGPVEPPEDFLQIEKLKKSLNKRNEFINASTTIPRDPSI